MNFEITKNKFKVIIQSLIDKEIKNLKVSVEKGEIPEDVSSNTIDDINAIESIKIANIESMKDFISGQMVYFCELDVIYDSVSGIALDDIVYDIQERIKRWTGIRVRFDNLGDVHNRYNDYGQI